MTVWSRCSASISILSSRINKLPPIQNLSRRFSPQMSTATSPFQITHIITLTTQPTEPVTVVAAPGVFDADFRTRLIKSYFSK
ncbi:hypothetical protein HanXRQr2_Chr08g0328491 [Helianthus annuus]|uniref:Uncharacterized protein n=1 Tax=Helianthus annuus TaxID=4232 RepID=A0A9K3IDZ6_HELAN|nr:hypothetical protein HanXRQr2_Chr08g0328491 [Helianthus annuus]